MRHDWRNDLPSRERRVLLVMASARSLVPWESKISFWTRIVARGQLKYSMDLILALRLHLI